ncbi:MAG TPA: Lrp/AsnC family transcriptional regulator [Terrimesophilobacter sp.]|jgi:Transcriptional regulators|uniref:Lrp/AsnC family transcriptional regulator n=1 Tax=Terrimesophilobacter sp. TaxID=2906435 RepID=UPI002F92FBC8
MSDFRKILQDSGCVSEPEAELLLLLADDGRISNARLAELTGMPPSTSLSRVGSLREAGVIRGFHTHVDRKSLQLNLQALVSIALKDQSPHAMSTALKEVMKLPHAIAVMKVTGTFHLVAQVHTRDSEQLQLEVLNPISRMPFIDRTDTSLILGHYRRGSFIGEFFEE